MIWRREPADVQSLTSSDYEAICCLSVFETGVITLGLLLLMLCDIHSESGGRHTSVLTNHACDLHLNNPYGSGDGINPSFLSEEKGASPHTLVIFVYAVGIHGVLVFILVVVVVVGIVGQVLQTDANDRRDVWVDFFRTPGSRRVESLH